MSTPAPSWDTKEQYLKDFVDAYKRGWRDGITFSDEKIIINGIDGYKISVFDGQRLSLTFIVLVSDATEVDVYLTYDDGYEDICYNMIDTIIVKGFNPNSVYDRNKQVAEDTIVKTGMRMELGENTTYCIAVRGDANGDGLVTASDLSVLKCHIVGIRPSSVAPGEKMQSPYLEAMDINYDGKITAVDLSQLKMMLVGLEIP